MNTEIWSQKNGGNIGAQKLYTQKDLAAVANDSYFAEKKTIPDSNVVADLVKKSNRILVSIRSHAFPFDLFPNTINIEEERVTIINRHFLSSEVHSFDIKNISNIFINSTILFAQLVIISKTYEENEIKIRNLIPAEAVFVRRIIEGLRVFENHQVDTSVYTKEELINKLEELSTTQIVS